MNGQAIKKQDLIKYSKEQLIDSLTDRYNDVLLDKSYHLKEIRLLQNELLKHQQTVEFHNLIQVDTADISNTYLEIETDTSYSDQVKKVESIYQEVRDNRNRRMQRIFVESQDVSHFAFSLLNVGDSLTPSFNANVSSHFFVLPTHWPIGLTLNPKFRLRMFLNQPSAPIRTPSNLIGATIFRHGGGFLSSIGGYRIYSASFYHHSNG